MGTSKIIMCSTKQSFVGSSANKISHKLPVLCVKIRTRFFYLCSPLMQVYANHGPVGKLTLVPSPSIVWDFHLPRDHQVAGIQQGDQWL